jgi:hypothetical protein
VGIKRLLSGWMGTLLVGVLAGFIVSSGIGVVVRDSGFFGASKESPIARAYMLGLLQRDPGSISGIRPNQSISQRAAELQGAETSRSTGSIQPLSLTYLGGAGAGGYSVHIYAVGLRTAEGDDQFFPMALTIAGGRVVRSE